MLFGTAVLWKLTRKSKQERNHNGRGRTQAGRQAGRQAGTHRAADVTGEDAHVTTAHEVSHRFRGLFSGRGSGGLFGGLFSGRGSGGLRRLLFGRLHGLVVEQHVELVLRLAAARESGVPGTGLLAQPIDLLGLEECFPEAARALVRVGDDEVQGAPFSTGLEATLEVEREQRVGRGAAGAGFVNGGDAGPRGAK